MSGEAGFFLLVLSIVTLAFNRWVTKEELKGFWANHAKEMAQAEVMVLEERLQLVQEKAQAAERELKRVAAETEAAAKAAKIEREALPVIMKDERMERQLEEEMLAPKKKDDLSWFDEVPGLGR